jgi:hypothetical protein
MRKSITLNHSRKEGDPEPPRDKETAIKVKTPESHEKSRYNMKP